MQAVLGRARTQAANVYIRLDHSEVATYRYIDLARRGVHAASGCDDKVVGDLADGRTPRILALLGGACLCRRS